MCTREEFFVGVMARFREAFKRSNWLWDCMECRPQNTGAVSDVVDSGNSGECRVGCCRFADALESECSHDAGTLTSRHDASCSDWLFSDFPSSPGVGGSVEMVSFSLEDRAQSMEGSVSERGEKFGDVIVASVVVTVAKWSGREFRLLLKFSLISGWI